MELIYSFTVALFLTIVLIPMLIRYAPQLRLIDMPDGARKIHDRQISRGGGLAIAIGVLLPLVFLLPKANEFKGLISGAVIIVLFGLLDDRFELNYRWKFLGQILAVLAAMSSGILICKVPFMGLEVGPTWLVYPLTFFFLLGVTNAVNLTDGLDGLAAGTSLLSFALITFFALKVEYDLVALFALTIIGGVLGFLRFNTFPARIFMGDGGSQFLGFTGAALAILISQYEGAAYSAALPLLLLGLPILDTLTVMSIRIRQGRSPFSPDKNHLHHQIMALGFRHYEAVAVIYILQMLLIGGSYWLCYENDGVIVGFYVVFSTVILATLYWGKKSAWRLHHDQARDLVQDRRNNFLRQFDWLYRHSAYVVEWAIALILLASAMMVKNVRGDFVVGALVLSLILAVMWFFWRKSPFLVSRASCYTAAVYVMYLLSQSDSPTEIVMAVNCALGALVLFLILAIRMTRRADFRLDNQDLLILLMVVVVPQLPIQGWDTMSVGQTVLRLAVLLYACEFVLAKSATKGVVLNAGSFFSLILLALHGL